MTSSKMIAGLIGPTLAAIAVAMLLNIRAFPAMVEQVARDPAQQERRVPGIARRQPPRLEPEPEGPLQSAALHPPGRLRFRSREEIDSSVGRT